MEARLAKCCVLIHYQVCKRCLNVAGNIESDMGLFIGISEAVIVEVN